MRQLPFGSVLPDLAGARSSHVTMCVLLVATLVAVAPGCASTMKRRELESVARDWSYTIRASQVMPVFPPSADVQPGDLFVVQMPVDQQEDVYDDLGFLPLGNLLARIAPTGYANFYADSFRLGATPEPLPESFSRNDGKGWKTAPMAAFPSYSFSVGRDTRDAVALPVSAVPIGMTLLDSGSADGSITISDVRTYGVDTASLFADVTRWALEPRNRELLKHYGPSGSQTRGHFGKKTQYNHLRIVSRVYVSRRVIVSLRDTGARSGRIGTGLPDGLDLFGAASSKDADATKQYERALAAVNAALEAALVSESLAPGGTLEVLAASSRSITLDETLLEPLVIAWLGFDMKIFENGELGPPVPTQAILTGHADAPDLIFQPGDPTVMCINRWLSVSDRDKRQLRSKTLVRWWVDKELPDPDQALTRIATNHYEVARKIFIAEAPIDCSEWTTP
jgi:hypothetical protein